MIQSTSLLVMQKGFVRLLLLLSFICLVTCVNAQGTQKLSDFNQERLTRTRNSMWVLGTWGVANLAVGAIGMRRSQGENRAFHQMNMAWGAVNLGLATTGWWTAIHTDPSSFDLYETLRQQHRLQKVFLFNAGLDVGYMVGGLWLKERAKTAIRRPERLRGFGRSILIQGAFLFVFDLSACIYHQGMESRVKPLLENVSIGMTGQGIGITIHW